MPAVSKRTRDENGYWLVRDNPISKVGVFPYMGAELPPTLGLEPNKLYHVYRPESSLSDPETLASFAGIPFIDDHTWLGTDGTPAEQKGVQGVTMANVHFDAPYLKSDIRIFSEAAQKLIESGKVELSPGYRAQYKIEPGVYDGKKYDLVQYNLRGNHLALVGEGRTGPDLAVQDHLSFTLDSMEFITMEFTPEQLAQIQAMIADAVAKALAEMKPAEAATDEDPEAMKEAAATPAKDEDVTPAAAEAVVESTAEAKDLAESLVEVVAEVEQAAEAVQEATASGNATDSAAALKRHSAALAKYRKVLSGKSGKVSDSGTVAKLAAQVQALQNQVKQNTVDAAGIAGQIAKRDALASKLSAFIGTFDHAPMGLVDVAKYGLEKVGIKGVPAGSECVVLDAWLHGRKPEAPAAMHDAAIPSNSLGAQWAKQNLGA